MYTRIVVALDGSPLKQLGMGGRDLKDKAASYLATAHETKGDAALLAEIEALKARLAALEPSEAEPEPEELSDEEKASPFADMEAVDLRNWLAAADPDLQIDKRWGKKTLIEKADEVNARLAQKAA